MKRMKDYGFWYFKNIQR